MTSKLIEPNLSLKLFDKKKFKVVEVKWIAVFIAVLQLLYEGKQTNEQPGNVQKTWDMFVGSSKENI